MMAASRQARGPIDLSKRFVAPTREHRFRAGQRFAEGRGTRRVFALGDFNGKFQATRIGCEGYLVEYEQKMRLMGHEITPKSAYATRRDSHVINTGYPAHVAFLGQAQSVIDSDRRNVQVLLSSLRFDL